MEDSIRIAIIEDVLVLRENVRYFLEICSGMEVVHESGSVESYLQYLENHSSFQPDILLLDVGLPGMSGIEGIPYIKSAQPKTDIIMLTSFEDEQTVLKALCAGAVGYVAKGADQQEVEDAVRTVRSGGSYMSPKIAREIVNHLMRGPSKQSSGISELLSERQNEIIQRLADGLSYGQIAEQLFVSVETVRSHIKKMYRVLQVNNKAEAIALYLKS